ncbi:MAG: UDP-N-acetylmuramate dehydrogenase [Desulfamplus sp.]|nr:UDP-N-acetylmuramate dehydrogenase [Desulfamplus sp.]
MMISSCPQDLLSPNIEAFFPDNDHALTGTTNNESLNNSAILKDFQINIRKISSKSTEMIFPSGMKIEFNVPMKRYTSFKIGGPADYFARPASVEELLQLLRAARNNSIASLVMGSGTNILVKDNGIRGLVISLVKMKNEIEIQDIDTDHVVLSASAGTILAALCRKTIRDGLEDFSFAAGIPGTVGGAVMMNAGTGIGTISDSLVSIDILDTDNNIRRLDRSQLLFSHRKLDFISRPAISSVNVRQKDSQPVILKASFLLRKGNREKVEQSWRTLIKKRKTTQPHGMPCAGCFFKNPDNGKSAGALIEMAGLKKRRVGDAMVSEKHANFIINLGNATAMDIITLKEIVKKTVFEKFSVKLSEEVIIQGE